MAISALYESSGTISTTEISLPSGTTYSSGSPVTNTGVFQVFIDLSAMAAGDQFDIKVYESAQSAGTQRLLYTATYVGVQAAPLVVLPSLVLMYKWDVTLKKIAGTDRSIAWSIRKIA